MEFYEKNGRESFKKNLKVQKLIPSIAIEWADILEEYISVKGKLSLSDIYESYKIIISKLDTELSEERVDALNIMKKAISILLHVWKYKKDLRNITNEVVEKFYPIFGNVDFKTYDVFGDLTHQMTSYSIDILILLFESSLKLKHTKNFKHEVVEVYSKIVTSLVYAIDVKDSYTRGHSERVANIAEKFGKTIQLKQKSLEELIYACKLHDVGKIGISDELLLKEGKLSKEEYDEMKKHCEYGYAILSNVYGLGNIAQIIKYHHERYDGKGYLGVSPDMVPENSKIICICDAFDAMSSNRTYRKALKFDEIILELRKGCSSQFDPIICKSFINFMISNYKSKVC